MILQQTYGKEDSVSKKGHKKLNKSKRKLLLLFKKRKRE